MSDFQTSDRRRTSRRSFLRLGAGMTAGALAGALPAWADNGTREQASGGGGARVIRHVKTSTRKICLTFDDMWSEYYTLRIGREFQRRGVQVTFFPVGLAVLNNLERPNPGYRNLYPRLRDMGHEFGCHLFTHRDFKTFDLRQLINEEMAPSLHTMRRALGPRFQPVGIRPPFGIVTDALKEMASLYDIPLILWGLDSQDAICKRNNCSRECQAYAPARFEMIRRFLGQPMASPADICQIEKEACDQTCVSAILKNYRGYLRPGTITLHHGTKSSLLAIPRILDLLDDWNMEPVRLSHLLRLASA